MDRLEFSTSFDTPAKRGRPKGSTKKKWRQIEELKERHRLAKELSDLDLGHDYQIDELDF
ncbi:DUF3545 family protein [Psychrobium sp. 1_MG-2023]|uniref:DUF3545 family protein n=1 Tax=Psychrobium sp. 1_MG-2023 TaxID=3062624 RepID=UPI000C334906|nr:DUF3545 family protein [Psychrobium sp. 1_MG-2023]MDP2561306.1 DUF3545 family protein [Psychrobium sp. 1_MG-2023]PKF54122.1 DUF3545 domain-containing protein [Alteromonadales bacterium alter-6D02]